MKTYKSTGLVYGKLWGCGEVSYPAVDLEADSREALIEEATEMLDGRLDSGMGFERLLGAILIVEEIESIEVEGKTYQRSEYETVFIGELSDEQQDYLAADCI